MTREAFIVKAISLSSKHVGVDLAMALSILYDEVSTTTRPLTARWTKEDIELLLDLDKTGLSHDDIAIRLHKPYRAIANKLYQLKRKDK